jgi:hypothetical protein
MTVGRHATASTSLRSRCYEGQSDLLQMQGLLSEGRSQTDDWRYPHVGELAYAFFMVACHLDPSKHIRLWHDDEEGHRELAR